jgi:hypothetical protein
MRRARIVRIEWDDLDGTYGDILTPSDILEELDTVYRPDLNITITGEPSFTMEESGK